MASYLGADSIIKMCILVAICQLKLNVLQFFSFTFNRFCLFVTFRIIGQVRIFRIYIFEHSVARSSDSHYRLLLF